MERALQPPILTGVEVDELFGYLTYRIRLDDRDNLSLLYGENGSGKTTLLWLIYAALSPARGEGLKKFISTVPFRRFKLSTSIGFTIEIFRPDANPGGYTFTIVTPGRSLSALTRLSANGKMNLDTNPELPPILEALAELKIDLHFLSDDRQMRSTSLSFLDRRRHGREPPWEVRWTTDEEQDTEADRNKNWLNVDAVAAAVLEGFRRQVIEQGNVGQQNSNTIYLSVTRRLIRAWKQPDEPTHQEFSDLIEELGALKERANPILKAGAISSIPFDEFKTLLVSAPAERQLDLVRILQPFIEASRARIDALSPLAKILDLLVYELNDFLKGKSVRFEIANGFSILSKIGQPLKLDSLSSGEKHLFFLLCSAFLSRRRRCIFLIDEPELSLNVYWQRNLPRTLLRLVEGAETQYLLATHSLEILTEFSDRISNLEGVDASS
jgi:predicted ATPase